MAAFLYQSWQRSVIHHERNISGVKFGSTLLPQDLQIPTGCGWAVTELFKLQRFVHKVNYSSPHAITHIVLEVFNDQLARNLPTPGSFEEQQQIRVLDIGPGLAMYHVLMDRLYGQRVTHYLVDRTVNKGSTQTKNLVWRDWHKDGINFYTSLSCATQINALNGVDASRIVAIDASQEALLAAVEPETVDIAMSLASCGYHYTFELYAKAVRTVLKRHGLLLLHVNNHATPDQHAVLADYGFDCIKDEKYSTRLFGLSGDDVLKCKKKHTKESSTIG